VYTSYSSGVFILTPLCILITALYCCSIFQVLGLHLESKLLWEPDLRWFHIKYEWSLDILEVLSGWSWCGHHTVMLCLYHVMIHSKVGCESFAYVSALKSILSSWTLPITLECILSLLLSVTAALMVFMFSLVNLLVCNYATQPQWHGAVFHPPQCSRYDLNTATSGPAGVCLHHLVQQLHIRLLHIISDGLSVIPPWLIALTHPTAIYLLRLRSWLYRQVIYSWFSFCFCIVGPGFSVSYLSTVVGPVYEVWIIATENKIQ
jgi:hypothetical protein